MSQFRRRIFSIFSIFKAFLLLIFVILLFLLLSYSPKFNFGQFYQHFEKQNRLKLKLDECRLPKVDPWDATIMEHINPKYCELARSYQECQREYPEISELNGGFVRVNKSLLSEENICQFRCLYPKSDFELLMGKWSQISAKPDCDIVEVQCNSSLTNQTAVHNYLHHQIFNPIILPPSNNATLLRPPDVHLLILDSISHPMFLRSLPKTSMWLREMMEVIPFPHLNKVGINSRPNAFAMLFGFQVSPIRENPMGEEYIPPRDADSLRWVYMDNESFISYEYRQRNYRTMMAEDWARGALNWPNYYGFLKQPTQHYMRPFHLRSEKMDDENGTLTANKSCKDYHHYVLDYLKQFIDAYENEPKMSITWYVDAAHNGPNGAFWIDGDFYDFLREYEKMMENAFLFIMADHGLRFRSIRDTKQGEIEDNNPALFVVVPKHLRRNRQLMDNLRENSRQLVSHFDVHATLLNIAKESSNWNAESTFAQIPVDLSASAPFGSSIFYPFPSSIPRNCGTLHIPFEYCLCQFHKKNETMEEGKMALELAQIMVDRMNGDIHKQNVSDLCMPLKLNENANLAVEILEFEPEKGINLFQVTFETVPGNGRFWGYIQLEERQNPLKGHNLLTTKFPRTNEYDAQAKCVDHKKHEIAPYCYCRDLLKTTQTPTTNVETTTTKTTQLPQNGTRDDQSGLVKPPDGKI